MGLLKKAQTRREIKQIDHMMDDDVCHSLWKPLLDYIERERSSVETLAYSEFNRICSSMKFAGIGDRTEA